MNKYDPKDQEKVHESLREMEEGKLKSGKGGKRVTNRKQAIAISLSEAHKAGGAVPKKNKAAITAWQATK